MSTTIDLDVSHLAWQGDYPARSNPESPPNGGEDIELLEERLSQYIGEWHKAEAAGMRELNELQHSSELPESFETGEAVDQRIFAQGDRRCTREISEMELRSLNYVEARLNTLIVELCVSKAMIITGEALKHKGAALAAASLTYLNDVSRTEADEDSSSDMVAFLNSKVRPWLWSHGPYDFTDTTIESCATNVSHTFRQGFRYMADNQCDLHDHCAPNKALTCSTCILHLVLVEIGIQRCTEAPMSSPLNSLARLFSTLNITHHNTGTLAVCPPQQLGIQPTTQAPVASSLQAALNSSQAGALSAAAALLVNQSRARDKPSRVPPNHRYLCPINGNTAQGCLRIFVKKSDLARHAREDHHSTMVRGWGAHWQNVQDAGPFTLSECQTLRPGHHFPATNNRFVP